MPNMNEVFRDLLRRSGLAPDAVEFVPSESQAVRDNGGAYFDQVDSKIYYSLSTSAQFLALPSIVDDFTRYRQTAEYVNDPLMNVDGVDDPATNYAFQVAIFHEIGHWKQKHQSVPLDPESLPTTLLEFHNIVVNENKFPGRKRMLYAPTITKTQMTEEERAVKERREQLENNCKFITLNEQSLPRVFVAVFCGGIVIPESPDGPNDTYSYKTDPKYIAVKGILSSLNSDGYTVREKMSLLKNLLVDYAGSNQTALATVTTAIINVNAIISKPNNLTFTQKRIAKLFAPKKEVKTHINVQERLARDYLVQFPTEPISQQEQTVISPVTTQASVKTTEFEGE